MFKKVFRATLLIFCASITCYSQNQKQEQWVDSVYNKLTNDQRIGQLFMVSAYSNGNDEHLQQIEELVKKRQIGGLIFMQGYPVKQIKITNRLQCLSKTPLLIGMDMEWGAGMRLDSTLSFPHQMALGAMQNDSLIYEMGKEIAREMKLLGVHLNFAPVVDINNNPLNPVIGIRSFGSDKNLVSNKGIAYLKGLQENGVLACAKHFPGHGDTQKDSHLTLPTINISKERLDTLELYPFKKMMNAGIASIMTGHIEVPALDSKKHTPVSLSEKAINGFLRKEFKYEGLIVTDALNMKAVSGKFKEKGEVEMTALKAGNDMLLFPEDIPAATEKIKTALRKKQIPNEQFEASVKRILRAKYKAGLSQKWKSLSTDNIYRRLNRPQAKSLQETLFAKSITTLISQDSLLPIINLDNRDFASLTIGGTGEFNSYLDKYAPFAHYDFESSSPKILSKELKAYNTVIVAVADISPSKANFGIPKPAIELINALEDETDIVLCVLGTPYAISLFRKPSGLLCTYENNALTQKLAAEAIFGSIGTSAQLPVSMKGYPAGSGVNTADLKRLGFSVPETVGMDADVLKKIDVIIREAIIDHATPGCQVLVAKNGKVVYQKSFGYYTYDSLKPVSNETIYDIASVTKVMASMQTFMFLEERGMVDLDKKASVYLPELKGSNKENMIWRDILTHQAGLWPYVPFWKQSIEDSTVVKNYYHSEPSPEYSFKVSDNIYASQVMQDSIWSWVINAKIRDKEPHVPFDYKYSDMGYYLLKQMAEKILNQPMNEFLQQNFYDPMGLSTMGYLPLCKYPLSRIAPTEQDTYFRNTLVYGLVHDQGAAMSGGVAGHAGLFSNSLDLAKMLQMHLQDGFYGGTRYYQPGTLEKFTSQQYKTNRRGIGWDKPAKGVWWGPTSRYASGKTFGHTGFTGTAIWADPEFDLIYIFLSNRVYPEAENSKLIKNNIRTRVQDVIYESMWEYNQYIDSY
ncbi:glycoside hydrolase family 3 N-terminal domain-containing protein [Fulvivirga ligni]|uniref:glycoside hydrolase family 3 N-terminal domain-containing protein n=1 Tax=Fulvivirga ligni TaxID=2904246 RepID=UPI001F40A2D9|nr:glycoside hydrolase family 3 N-terminal domain-containing protein [Fulvivirga ligni]UII21419.1 serine hydrolase [Fulvivirga ligni]